MNKEMKKDVIVSTLISNGNAIVKENIPVNKLIQGYKNQLGIDVSKYFKGIKEIKLYECLETKYRFYYPLYIEGG